MFAPNILESIENSARTIVCRKATNITRWPLSIHGPLSSWSRGKTILIGDTAHPVSPTSPLVLSGLRTAILIY